LLKKFKIELYDKNYELKYDIGAGILHPDKNLTLNFIKRINKE
jgi:hypothetical protein